MKMVIVILLLGVIISLGFALFSMKSSGGRSARMLRALTIRIVFSQPPDVCVDDEVMHVDRCNDE